ARPLGQIDQEIIAPHGLRRGREAVSLLRLWLLLRCRSWQRLRLNLATSQPSFKVLSNFIDLLLKKRTGLFEHDGGKGIADQFFSQLLFCSNVGRSAEKFIFGYRFVELPVGNPAIAFQQHFKVRDLLVSFWTFRRFLNPLIDACFFGTPARKPVITV